MTNYDIQNLIKNIDLSTFKDDLSEMRSTELVSIYKALTKLVSLCLRCVNIPHVVFTLSEIQYAFALEITNRYLFGHEDDIRALDIPFECLPEYATRTDF